MFCNPGCKTLEYHSLNLEHKFAQIWLTVQNSKIFILQGNKTDHSHKSLQTRSESFRVFALKIAAGSITVRIQKHALFWVSFLCCHVCFLTELIWLNVLRFSSVSSKFMLLSEFLFAEHFSSNDASADCLYSSHSSTTNDTHSNRVATN